MEILELKEEKTTNKQTHNKKLSEWDQQSWKGRKFSELEHRTKEIIQSE